MALSTRAIRMSAEWQKQESFDFSFTPKLTGADDELLLSKTYRFRLYPDGKIAVPGATYDSWTKTEDSVFNLPTRSVGTISYQYKFPADSNGYQHSTGWIHLSAGAEINIDDLIPGSTEATDTLKDYIDEQVISVVPLGGSTGQVLKKASDTDHDTEWANDNAGSSAIWGGITGTLSNQTDLQNALNDKQPGSANLEAWALLAPSAKQDQSANLDSWSLIAPSAKQDASANLTTFAGIAPSANVQSLLAAADYAAIRTLLAVEPAITAGTTAQYLRGDKSLGTLNQAAVAGLTTASSPTFAGLGLNTATPRRLADFLSASAPQLRLSHTDNSVYTDLQTDSNGYLNISPSGNILRMAGKTAWVGELWADSVLYSVSVARFGSAPDYFHSSTAHFRGNMNRQWAWCNNASASLGTVDTGLARAAAAIVKVTNGSTGAGALQFQEMTAPTAPSADNAIIFAEDDGAGKTRIVARFASGADVILATQA